jgi:hypothetical protein
MSEFKIVKERLYSFVDSLRLEKTKHFVIALESEKEINWGDESYEYDEYELIPVLKNDSIVYAWIEDLEEI